MTVRTAGLPGPRVDASGLGSSSRTLAVTLFVACLLHLLLILGVSFRFPEHGSGKQVTRPLEIMVLRQAASSENKPKIADAFAQVDREGGGIEERPDTHNRPNVEPVAEVPQADPLTALAEPLPPLMPPPEPADLASAASGQPADPMVLALPEPEQESEPFPKSQPLEEPEPTAPQVTAAEILATRNLEIAELTARIQRSSVAYASRPRRKAISASTREYKYASYLEAWRRKVERVGNLNYPEEAKRHGIYGNLILHVALGADGSIEDVNVLRSSGFDLLDKAAIKIVKLAAPYAPFPPDIKAETDVLDITRTWQFLSSNRLGWEN